MLTLSTVYLLVAEMILSAEMASVAPTLTTASGGADGNLKVDNKSLHFVDEIKQHLRRNNDDYVDRGTKPVQVVKTRRLNNGSEDTLSHPDIPDTPDNPDSSDTPDNPDTPDTPDTTDTPDTQTAVIPTLANNSNVFRSFLDQDNQELHKALRSGKGKHEAFIPQRITMNSPLNKEDRKSHSRGDSWKRLVDKNQRLKAYTSTPKIEPSAAPQFPTNAVTRHVKPHPLPVPQHERAEKHHAKLHPQAIRARDLHKILPLRTPGPGRAPPNADQLDMAPARGAYIHDLRVKGLFCHRNVLWPEGPKYDSKGNTIMPAFDPKAYKNLGKSFVDTTKALFVLPRCCNCCRKSVLGCQ